MFEWIGELTRQTLSLDTDIHISDRNELIIENCRRIEECNEVFMRFLAGSIYVNIHGSGLRAYDFRTGALVVRGCIDRLEFEERRVKHGPENKTVYEDKCQRKRAE